MSVVNTYRVFYHFEQSGKKAGPDYSDYLQASASDYNTIKTVLTNNSRIKQGTLVLDSVQEIGHGDQAIA